MNRLECYKTLGLSVGASKDDIKKTYRNLAKQWHPDVNKSLGATEVFKKINEAYQTLMSEPVPTIGFDFSSIFNNIPRRDFNFTWNKFGGHASITLEIDRLTQDDGENLVNLIKKAGFNVKGYSIEIRS